MVNPSYNNNFDITQLLQHIAYNAKYSASELKSSLRQQKELVTIVNVTAVKLNAHRSRVRQLRKEFRDLWLVAMCDQLHYTLPRELRDLIYTNLLNGAEIHCTGGTAKDAGTSNPGGVQWTLTNDWELHNSDWFEIKSLGCRIFRELVQSWYGHLCLAAPFIVRRDLQDFLRRDKWGLGDKPLDHLRVVEILIH